MSASDWDIQVLLQQLLATMTYTQPSPEQIAHMRAAAGVYAQLVATFAAIPAESHCQASAREALGDAFLWTLRGIAEYTEET